jgi:hypothetical protein
VTVVTSPTRLITLNQSSGIAHAVIPAGTHTVCGHDVMVDDEDVALDNYRMCGDCAQGRTRTWEYATVAVVE